MSLDWCLRNLENLRPPSSSSNEDDNESNEPDHNQDKDQLEEKQNELTNNKVF